MNDSVLEHLRTTLKDDWKRSVGGSYYFEREGFFRPNWLSGDWAHKVKITYNDQWTRIEFFINGEEWEKFFEGGIYSIVNMDLVLHLLEIDTLL